MRFALCLMVVAWLVLSSSAAGAETAEQNGAIPRLPNGKPDFNGVWQVLNTANYDILAHPARAAMAMQPGPFGPVPAEEVVAFGAVGSVRAGMGVVDGNELPYLPDARAKQQENQANWLTRDPEVKCYLPGVPRATYMPFPFQIFQSDSAIFVAYEYAGATRNFMLEDPGEAPVDSWMGQSVASWDGDTLVVEVTGQSDATWFDRSGNHHSAYMKVTERYTLRNINTGQQISFATIFAALNALGRIDAVPLVDASLLREDADHTVRLRAQVSIADYPLSLKYLLFWRDDWRVASNWYTWPLVR